jgi:hypothetical protein
VVTGATLALETTDDPLVEYFALQVFALVVVVVKGAPVMIGTNTSPSVVPVVVMIVRIISSSVEMNSPCDGVGVFALHDLPLVVIAVSVDVIIGDGCGLVGLPFKEVVIGVTVTSITTISVSVMYFVLRRREYMVGEVPIKGLDIIPGTTPALFDKANLEVSVAPAVSAAARFPAFGFDLGVDLCALVKVRLGISASAPVFLSGSPVSNDFTVVIVVATLFLTADVGLGGLGLGVGRCASSKVRLGMSAAAYCTTTPESPRDILSSLVVPLLSSGPIKFDISSSSENAGEVADCGLSVTKLAKTSRGTL